MAKGIRRTRTTSWCGTKGMMADVSCVAAEFEIASICRRQRCSALEELSQNGSLGVKVRCSKILSIRPVVFQWRPDLLRGPMGRPCYSLSGKVRGGATCNSILEGFLEPYNSTQAYNFSRCSSTDERSLQATRSLADWDFNHFGRFYKRFLTESMGDLDWLTRNLFLPCLWAKYQVENLTVALRPTLCFLVSSNVS